METLALMTLDPDPCHLVPMWLMNVSKVASIRNQYNQVPHLTQDTNGKVTNSQSIPQTRAKRSALSNDSPMAALPHWLLVYGTQIKNKTWKP